MHTHRETPWSETVFAWLLLLCMAFQISSRFTVMCIFREKFICERHSWNCAIQGKPSESERCARCMHVNCFHLLMCMWALQLLHVTCLTPMLSPLLLEEFSASVGDVHSQEERSCWCLVCWTAHGPRENHDQREPNYEQNGLHHRTTEWTWEVQRQGLPVIHRLRLEVHTLTPWSVDV